MILTVILVICLFLYFLWGNLKETKKKKQQWGLIGCIPEDTFIYGSVLRLQTSTYKYYPKFNVYKLELQIQDDESYIHQALYEKPLTNDFLKPVIQVEDSITCYGQWRNKIFYINRIEKQS